MRLVMGASVLALAAATLGLVAAPAGAATRPGHAGEPVPISAGAARAAALTPAATTAFSLNNFNDLNMCLGITGGETDVPAVLWTCNGSADQTWHWGSEFSSTRIYFQLVNGDNNCLGVQGGSTANDARIVGWHCLTGHPDQYWAPIAFCTDAAGIQYDAYQNLGSGLVIGVSGNSTARGAAIVQFTYQKVCNNQFWAAILA
jgi:hypothetical protein